MASHGLVENLDTFTQNKEKRPRKGKVEQREQHEGTLIFFFSGILEWSLFRMVLVIALTV